MKGVKHTAGDKALGDMWNLLFSIIYIAIFILITLLGYITFEDSINRYLNQKEYSQEELALMDKKAMARISAENEEKNWDRIADGIHIRTGLHDDPNLKLIIATCTSCHSAKLITQNRATKSGWKTMIKWMQKSQGLPDLGSSEPIILDYLAKYYAPKETGRRKNLNIDEIKWYVLNIEE